MRILRENQYLRHAQYGLGVVSESNADRTTIDFELHGVKKFVTDLMQCELLAEAAPVRTPPAKKKRKARAASPKTGV